MPKSSGVIGSLLWKGGERAMVQGLGLLIQVVLARLLLPKDFASLAIINAIINYLGIFVQSGLSIAVVQKKELSEKDLSTLTSISLFVALILFIGLYFIAPFVSEYYCIEELTWPIRVMGISLFLFSFNSIQTGLLTRKMMFRSIFFRSMLATPLSGIIGIAMAYMGMGIWALVGYCLTNILSIVIFMNMIPELRLRLGFSWQSAKEIYGFSIKIIGTNLISAGGDTIRTMTIGKVFSPEKLAFYDRGYSYSSLVTQVVNTSLSSVLLPVFSRQQDDIQKLRELARRSVSMSAFVMIPILVFVAVAAQPLVSFVLSEKWLPCAVFLSLFCILRIPGIITSIDKDVYYSLGKSQIGLYYEIGILAVNLLSLTLMIPYGVWAIAIGYTVVEFFGNFILCIISSRVFGYSLWDRCKDLVKPVFNSAVMAMVAYAMTRYFERDYVLVAMQMFVSGVVYILMSWITHDKNLFQVKNIIRNRKQ